MKNRAQKQLIESLTVTHGNPKKGYTHAIKSSYLLDDKKQIEKIAKKYNINIK